MAHELSTNAAGEVEFAYAGGTPWHGLGVHVPALMTPLEALVAARLDWDVVQSPIFVPPHVGDGPLVELEGKVVNRRGDDGRVLGLVSEDYSIVQNRDVAAFVDSLVEGGAAVETCGALKEGRRTFFLVRTGDPVDVRKGDEVVPYLLVMTGHDGQMRFRAQFTSVRVVCQNTLQAAADELRTGKVVGTFLSHVGDVEARTAEAQSVLAQSTRTWARATEWWATLAQTSVLASEVDDFLRGLFPDPKAKAGQKEPHPMAVRSVLSQRAAVLANYEAGVGAAPGTAWGLLNAATEFATHQVTPTLEGDGASERRMNSFLEGRSGEVSRRATKLVGSLVAA